MLEAWLRVLLALKPKPLLSTGDQALMLSVHLAACAGTATASMAPASSHGERRRGTTSDMSPMGLSSGFDDACAAHDSQRPSAANGGIHGASASPVMPPERPGTIKTAFNGAALPVLLAAPFALPVPIMNASQKIALVTGATRGIGFETCRQLAQAGALVLLAGRSAAGAAKA